VEPAKEARSDASIIPNIPSLVVLYVGSGIYGCAAFSRIASDRFAELWDWKRRTYHADGLAQQRIDGA